MKFEKGKSGNPEGRPQGAQNKFTKTVREVFTTVFNDLQEDKEANLKNWALKNPTEFYRLATKLIPSEITAEYKFIEQPLFPDIILNDERS